MPLGVGIPRPRRALARKRRKIVISDEGHDEKFKDDGPLIIVARPRAVPIPLPLIALTPVRLNLRKRICKLARVKFGWWSRGADIGAFCNISGTMKNRTMLPLM